jgi:hypothetical protein
MLEGEEGMRSLLACSNSQWQQAHRHLSEALLTVPRMWAGSRRFSHVVPPTAVDCLAGASVLPS